MSSLEDMADFMQRLGDSEGKPEEMKALLKEAFEFMDKDKSGFIEREEIVQMFKSLMKMVFEKAGIKMEDLPEQALHEMKAAQEDQVTQTMQMLDDNGDGKISFEEFLKGAKHLKDMQNTQ